MSKKTLSRRAFLRNSASAVATTFLAACGAAPAAQSPTAAPEAPAAPTPTAAPAAVATAEATSAAVATTEATSAAAETAIAATSVPAVATAAATEATAAATASTAGALTFTSGQHAGLTLGSQLVFKTWQERTGVPIDWRAVPSPSLAEKIKLMLSSGDVTDIFIGNRGLIKEIGPQACLPLDDLIAEHAPNYTKFLAKYPDQVAALRSSDGKTYGIFGRNDTSYKGWIYRKDLADKLGITKLETVDDWHGFLKAAKDSDPSSIGIGIYGSVLDIASSLRGAYGIHGNLSGWLTMRDGKLVDGSVLPEAKEVITTVRSWFGEGLIDPEMVATVEYQPASDKWMAGKSVVGPDEYMDTAFSVTKQYLNQNPGANFQISVAPPPKGPNGEQADLANYTGWSGFGYGLGPKCKDPVAAIRFIDYIFSDEAIALYWLGVEGQTYEHTGDTYQFTAQAKADIEKTIKESPEGVSGGTQALWYLYGIGYPFFAVPAFPAPPPMQAAQVGISLTEPEIAAAEAMRPFMNRLIPAPNFTEDETSELATLRADLETYQEETWTKMINGELAMDQWDSYVAQMKELGGDRVVEIYNTANQRT